MDIVERVLWDSSYDTRQEAADEIERLRAENAELRKLTEWQPIETAPKDGTVIRLFEREPYRWDSLGKWDEGDEFWDAFDGERFDNPTHWMPLQAPPNGDE